MTDKPPALRLRRASADSDDQWTVRCDGIDVGSIGRPGGRPEPIWQWSITVAWPSPGIAKSGQGETREECMAQFRAAWDRYRAAIGDEKWCWHVAHTAEVAARSRQPRRY